MKQKRIIRLGFKRYWRKLRREGHPGLRDMPRRRQRKLALEWYRAEQPTRVVEQ